MECVKDDDGKLKLSKVPPEVIDAIAKIREYGAMKYEGADDWREIAAGKIDIINYICRGVREMNAAPRHTADTAKLPILQDCESLVHIDYANRKSKNQINRYKAWLCPECGWFVGEQYTPTWARATPHNQQKCNFCSRCGQRIDWQTVESGTQPQREDV